MQAGNNIRTTTDNRKYYPRSFVITKIEELKSNINKKTDWVVISKNKKHAQKVVKFLLSIPGVFINTRRNSFLMFWQEVFEMN